MSQTHTLLRVVCTTEAADPLQRVLIQNKSLQLRCKLVRHATLVTTVHACTTALIKTITHRDVHVESSCPPNRGHLTVKHLTFARFTYLDHCTGHLFIVAAGGQPVRDRERDRTRGVQLLMVEPGSPAVEGGILPAASHLTDTCFNTTTASLPPPELRCAVKGRFGCFLHLGTGKLGVSVGRARPRVGPLARRRAWEREGLSGEGLIRSEPITVGFN